MTAILDAPEFAQFVAAYPAGRRCAPRVAAAAFSALEHSPEWQEVLAGLDTHKASAAWQEKAGKFVPGMAKFIEAEMWKGAGTCKRQRRSW